MGINSLKWFFFICACLVLMLAKWKYSSMVDQLQEVNSKLVTQQAQVSLLTNLNHSMKSTITRLKQASQQERLATEQTAREREQWQQRALRAKQQIEKDIANEECANLPIPHSGDWMYYEKNASRH
ncbi:hypothetical protein [Photobacterium leiognathi]|uniref:hypothetical protein n=1 Tax=Photobacterium leiognathi TaxID=553611 RepID=UPI002981C564|nr:hypothetical protein [Photobacterium leiognathi]